MPIDARNLVPSIWDVLGIKQAFKAAATSLATTVLTQDPDLFLPINATGLYVYDAVLHFNTLGATGNTPGLILRVNFSGSIDATYGNDGSIVGTSNASVAGQLPVNVSVSIDLLTGSTPAQNELVLHGTVQCTTTGVLSIQWSQHNASGNAVNLNPGSYLGITRIIRIT